MTSTTSPSPSLVTPPPTVFSYAQAAKGRGATTTAPAVLSSQGPSGISTPAKDPSSSVNTPPASINGTTTSSDGGDRERNINGAYDAITKSDPLGVGMESESRTATLVNSIPASPSFGTSSTSTLPKEEDIALTNAAPSESVWDRHFQPVNGAEKAMESPEGRRGKKSKKQKNAEREAEKEAEKQKEEEKKLEVLVAAPPPAVNIWQQRREAQALKVKPSPPISQTPQMFSEIAETGEPISKQTESKKRGKSNAGDDAEKIIGSGTTTGAKELSSTPKAQKKGSESVSKGKEDISNKRVGPRGSRVAESEKQAGSPLPPPVEDAMSWPTPDIALEEEKRKASEKERFEKEKDREDRDDTPSNKPRPKEKWVAVPYVPTVNFATPLPASRGGRGRGGGRGGRDSAGRSNHSSNGGANGERTKDSSATSTSPAGEPETRGRGGSTTTRATSLPPNSVKRPSSDSRPTGKISIGTNAEKAKVSQANQPVKNEPSSNGDAHRTSQLDQSLENQQTGRGDGFRGSKSEGTHGPVNESVLKSGTGDRRSESSLKSTEQFKDGTAFSKDAAQSRERTDGRGDRGRGGFRGRGGHNNFSNGPNQSQIPFTNGHGPQPPNGYPLRHNSTPYSPSVQAPPFSNQYAQSSARGGRGGSRSQSIPNTAMYSRFPPNINSQMAPLQTQNPMYDYQQPPPQSMSAGPYGSYPEQFPLLAMVTMQLEYYFSIDNLCKDVYLRKHMDSQGFVFLNFIAGFKRIQALTQEIELLRFACQESALIDVIKGEDGIDRLRRKDGWEKWVLAIDERDVSVRTAGPLYHQQYASSRMQPHAMAMMHGYPAMSPPAFSPTGAEPRFIPQFGNGSQGTPVVNGNGSNHHSDTPLSANVPDFAPSNPPINGVVDNLQEETTFSDEQVANLKLVFAPPKANDASKAEASHSASSRTLSNGSIDGRSIAEELHDDPRHGRGLTNGSSASDISPDSLRRSRSPFATTSPTTKTNINTELPVMWAKGQRQQAPISKDSTDELYIDIRARALRHREQSLPGITHADMKQLYEFWSQFLCEKFNPTMYNEFRKFAIADAEVNAMDGLRCLISYYDETLNNRKKVISDDIARHYVDLVIREKVTTESGLDRPAFTKLRAAWRNGALDVKSRKKIDNLVDQDLREELDR